MICPTCGAEVADNTRFCGMCGNPITTMDGAQPEVPQTPVYQAPVQQVPVPPVPATNNESQPNKKNTQPILPGLFSAIAFIAGTFLPYFSVSVFSVKGETALIDGADGVIFLLVGVIALVCALAGSKKGLIIVGGIALLLAGFEGYNVFHDGEYAALRSREIGYYCTLVGSIAIIATGLFCKKTD